MERHEAVDEWGLALALLADASLLVSGVLSRTARCSRVSRHHDPTCCILRGSAYTWGDECEKMVPLARIGGFHWGMYR